MTPFAQYTPLTQDEIVARAATIIRQHLGPEYRIFLFGSRSAGFARHNSDYDIAVEGPQPIPSTVRSDIEDELETLPTLATVELIDFSQVSTRFKTFAMQAAKELLP